MSHNSIYRASFTNLDALRACCEVKGYKFRLTSSVSMYGRNSAEAVAGIELPGWRYEIAVKANGDIIYDHFGSEANTMEHLSLLKQAYNQEVVIGQAWEHCDNYYEEELEDSDDFYGVQVEKGDYALIMEYEE